MKRPDKVAPTAALGAPVAPVATILNRQRRVSVAVAPLAHFLERVRRELRFPDNGVAVRLISDATMARLNHAFRGKAGPTDVLSFPANGVRPASRKPGRHRPHISEVEDGYIGDIAIAPETARRNARQYSRSLPEELRILILHGMIHLAGYDHETDNGRMNRLEQRLRARLGLKTT
jgi:probable rRNA maturation factor